MSTKYKKQSIPGALRKQVWIARMGKVFEAKCPTTWCSNIIDVYDFESGHNIPESKGGPTNIDNLIPICASCNRSMGDRYTFDEWCKEFEGKPKEKKSWSWFGKKKQEEAHPNSPLSNKPRFSIRSLFNLKVKKRLRVSGITAG